MNSGKIHLVHLNAKRHNSWDTIHTSYDIERSKNNEDMTPKKRPKLPVYYPCYRIKLKNLKYAVVLGTWMACFLYLEGLNLAKPSFSSGCRKLDLKLLR